MNERLVMDKLLFTVFVYTIPTQSVSLSYMKSFVSIYGAAVKVESAKPTR